LNVGSGGENPDEPPDCLYGLQVRGSPFSLRGSLFWARRVNPLGRKPRGSLFWARRVNP